MTGLKDKEKYEDRTSIVYILTSRKLVKGTGEKYFILEAMEYSIDIIRGSYLDEQNVPIKKTP